MEIEYTRDYLMTAAVFGMFSFIWFGWAQEKPPKQWVIPLGISSAIGFIIACVGGYLASQNWDSASTLVTESDYKTFGIVVAFEVLSIAVGSIILKARRQSQYISTWISFVVGIHFIPLSYIFEDQWLYLLTLLTLTGSIAPLYLSKRFNISISALTGLFVGSAILLFAVRGIILYALA